eukprot:6709439-Pyramimonas_sp.AAC.1
MQRATLAAKLRAMHGSLLSPSRRGATHAHPLDLGTAPGALPFGIAAPADPGGPRAPSFRGMVG